MNAFKSPRDKLIQLLNSCKIIFALIRRLDAAQGADAFLPLLVFVLLKANVSHLVSNVEYIKRFRNPERLEGEPSYYLSSLGAAISFIEALDHSSLSGITQDDFEQCVASSTP